MILSVRAAFSEARGEEISDKESEGAPLKLQAGYCKTSQPPKMVSQLSRVWNPLFKSLIRVYTKLKALGFTYYNGKVSVIEPGEEESK